MEYNPQKSQNHYAVHLKLTQYCKSTILKNKRKIPESAAIIAKNKIKRQINQGFFFCF